MPPMLDPEIGVHRLQKGSRSSAHLSRPCRADVDSHLGTMVLEILERSAAEDGKAASVIIAAVYAVDIENTVLGIQKGCPDVFDLACPHLYLHIAAEKVPSRLQVSDLQEISFVWHCYCGAVLWHLAQSGEQLNDAQPQPHLVWIRDSATYCTIHGTRKLINWHALNKRGMRSILRLWRS